VGIEALWVSRQTATIGGVIRSGTGRLCADMMRYGPMGARGAGPAGWPGGGVRSRRMTFCHTYARKMWSCRFKKASVPAAQRDGCGYPVPSDDWRAWTVGSGSVEPRSWGWRTPL
jgi:hypothetical protein